MTALRRWVRGRMELGEESGMSMMEVVVASAIVAVAIAIALPVIFVAHRVTAGQAERTDANSEAVIVLAQIERDVRSGNVIWEPEDVGGVDGSEVTIYTQVGRTAFSCVQYRLFDRELRRRSWSPGSPPGAAWTDDAMVLARGVENNDLSLAAFSRSADGHTLDVHLVLRSAPEPGPTVTVQSSITSRNTRQYNNELAEAQCNEA